MNKIFAALCLLILAGPVAAAKHAFVLGNANYTELSDLQNTHADAAAYAEAFKNLGYSVHFYRDLMLDETADVFDEFLDELRPGDEVAFVYSGHGWSNGGTNYLAPVDAPKQGRDRKLIRASIALKNGINGVLDEFEAAGAALTVAIIDACRNNPFTPPAGRKSLAISRGLAPVKAATGTFVIFSAGEGQEALDRLPADPPGENLSVFTRSFLPHLKSGIYLEDAISKAQVETAALAAQVGGHIQHPAYYDQTLGQTCLANSCQVSLRNQNTCDALYAEAKEARACFAYDAYLTHCGTHIFAPFAKSFLAQNCAVAPSAKTETPPSARAKRESLLAAWRKRSPLVRTTLTLPKPVGETAYVHDDGKHLTALGKDIDGEPSSEFTIFDLQEPVRVVFESKDAPSDQIVLDWDENRYFQTSVSGNIEVRDSRTKALLKEIPSKGEHGVRNTFDYNAKQITFFWNAKKSLVPFAVLDANTFDVLLEGEMETEWAEYFNLEYSPNNTRISLLDKKPLLTVWDIPTGKRFEIDAAPHLVDAYQGPSYFSHDSSKLYLNTGLGKSQTLLTFDIESGALVSKTLFDSYLWPIAFHEEGELTPLRFGSTEDGYAVWRESDWSVLSEFKTAGDKWLYESALDLELGFFALLSPKGDLAVFDLLTGEELHSLKVTIGDSASVTFAPDRRGLYLVSSKGLVSKVALPPQD